jgi:ribosomal protein S2
MKQYISTYTENNIPILNINEIYNRVRLAAAIIAGIDDVKNVFAVSSRKTGQRSVVKFSYYTGCSFASDDKWTSGSLTNH